MSYTNEYMRSIMDFYQNQNMDDPIVIERLKEDSAERMVLSRLERAIFDESDDNCSATHARYAIWGEDIRSLALNARDEMKQENYRSAERLINIVVNSMGAYIDAQSILDSEPENMRFIKPKSILESYIEAYESKNFEGNEDSDYIIKHIKETIADRME